MCEVNEKSEFRFYKCLHGLGCLRYNYGWRAPAHCGMANLVRSGTKQPQSFPASAADQARQLSIWSFYLNLPVYVPVLRFCSIASLNFPLFFIALLYLACLLRFLINLINELVHLLFCKFRSILVLTVKISSVLLGHYFTFDIHSKRQVCYFYAEAY